MKIFNIVLYKLQHPSYITLQVFIHQIYLKAPTLLGFRICRVQREKQIIQIPMIVVVEDYAKKYHNKIFDYFYVPMQHRDKLYDSLLGQIENEEFEIHTYLSSLYSSIDSCLYYSDAEKDMQNALIKLIKRYEMEIQTTSPKRVLMLKEAENALIRLAT